MCTHETGAYSTLLGEVMGVAVLPILVKFGVSELMQFATSSEEAQYWAWSGLCSKRKLTNHFLPWVQLFSPTMFDAVQL